MPTGSSAIAPSGTIACLRFAIRSASSSMFHRRAKRAMICPIRRSRSSSRRSGRPAKSATTSAVRSSAVGPEAAARHDQLRALGPHELAMPIEVVAGGRP